HVHCADCYAEDKISYEYVEGAIPVYGEPEAEAQAEPEADADAESPEGEPDGTESPESEADGVPPDPEEGPAPAEPEPLYWIIPGELICDHSDCVCGEPCLAENTDAEDASDEVFEMSLSPLGNFTTPDNGLSVAAELNGIDLNGGGDDDTFTSTDRASEDVPQTLVVNATFSADESVTERTVTVKLGHGLMFNAMQGFNSSNVYVDGSAGDLQGKINTTDTKYTADPNIYMSNATVSAGSGTVTYVFKNPTDGTTIEKATITLSVKGNKAFFAKAAERTFKDAIQVTASQTEGETIKKTDTLKLENYTITGLFRPVFYGDTSTRTQYVNPGGSVSFKYYFSNTGGNYTNTQSYGLYEEIVVAVKFPKGLTPDADNTITIPSGSNLVLAALKSEITQNGDGSSVLKITGENIRASGSNAMLTMNAKVGNEVADGDSLVLSLDTENCSYKPYEGAENSVTGVGHSSAATVSVTNAAPALEFYTATSSGANYRGYVNPATMESGDMTNLANIAVRNPSPGTTDSQGIKIVFPTDKITVRGVRLPQGASGGIYDLKVKLTDDRTLEIGNYTSLGGALNGITYSDFILANQDISDDTVGIASLEYRSVFPGSYGSSTYAQDPRAPLGVYGRFKGYVSSFAVDISVNNGGIPGDGNSWPGARSFTTNVTQEGGVRFMITRASMTGGSGSTASVTAGESRSVSYRVELSNSDSLPLSTSANNAGGLYYHRGFEIFLREAGVLNINSSTIGVRQLANGQTTSLDVTVQERQDNTGSRVWRISVPSARVAGMTLSSINFLVDYDFTVKSTATAQTLNSSDLIFVRPLREEGQSSPYVVRSGSFAYWNNLNTYNVAGEGDTDKYYGTGDNRVSFAIEQRTDFTVATAARLVIDVDGEDNDYDSGFINYEGNNIFALNQYGKITYQARVRNNNGNASGEFAVHIPIPTTAAATADWGGDTIGAAFEYNTAINSAVSVPAGFSGDVRYSSQYIPDTSDGSDLTSFKTWDNVDDKRSIKTVRIAATSVAANADMSFTFGLDLLDSDGNVAAASTPIEKLAAFAGKKNIYAAKYKVAGGVSEVNSVSGAVGAELHTGIIRGLVYNDVNRSGSYDSGDTPRGNVRVDVYENREYSEQIGSSIYTDSNGVFSVMNVNNGQTAYLEIANPSSNDGLRFAGGYSAAAASFKISAMPGASLEPAVVVGLGEPYTVSFAVNPAGATKPTDQKVYPGGNAASPETQYNPTLLGYTFDGWYTTSGYASEFNFGTAISANTTIYGKLSPKTVAVTYNLNYGGAGNYTYADMPAGSTSGKYDGKLTAPTAPTRQGYDFSGWYKTENSETAWNFDSDTLTVNNGVTNAVGGTAAPALTLYAGWTLKTYTVSYNLDGGKTTDGAATIPALAGVNWTTAGLIPESNPVKGYNKFIGWKLGDMDVTGETPYSALADDDSVSSVTLTATWEYVFNDVDGDGTPNEEDNDIDGDGLDNGEDPDIDGDGEPNGTDPDVDGDGIPNGTDPDIDGDGIPNNEDLDMDGDGVPNGGSGDIDGDGTPNEEDDDIDGDGIKNEDDDDDDNDGVPDDKDKSYNADDDIDGDGLDSDEDDDIDNDGKDNDTDDDVDGDGIPNDTDPDIDGDGIPNGTDDNANGGTKRTVTFLLNNGTQDTHHRTIVALNGTLDENMPGNPTRAGYVFAGWYTEQTGGTQFTADTPVTADTTLWARWNSVYIPPNNPGTDNGNNDNNGNGDNNGDGTGNNGDGDGTDNNNNGGGGTDNNGSDGNGSGGDGSGGDGTDGTGSGADAGNGNGSGTGGDNTGNTPNADVTPTLPREGGSGPLPDITLPGGAGYSDTENGNYAIVDESGHAIGTLVPEDDGSFTLIGEDSVPLGAWIFSEDEGMWIFDEYPPLGSAPVTGRRGAGAYLLMLVYAATLGAVLLALLPREGRGLIGALRRAMRAREKSYAAYFR
ncbi:MAG: InlB B-repeat-containing protein, partial [Oscillospiraceae bacterium]|nr:InlB B-repeat-containing protein [Oscillospiraceae bacterium]